MPCSSRVPLRAGFLLSVAVLAVVALGIPWARRIAPHSSVDSSGRRPTGYPQLVSIEPMSGMIGEMCQWVPASASAPLAMPRRQALLATQSRGAHATTASSESKPSAAIDRAPLRVLADPNPAFSAIAIEPESGMLMVTDENLFQLLEYNRLDNTPAQAKMTEPRRIISGPVTKAEMMCGVYIDPKTRDVYILNGDTQGYLAVFSKEKRGNVEPDRYLKVRGNRFGLAVDEERQEMFITIEDDKMVLVYRKDASGDDLPIRRLAGNQTQLDGPRGITLDTKRQLLFVSNAGNAHDLDFGKNPGDAPVQIPGSGRFEPASITVHALEAHENTPPLRIIEGPNTQLNVPSHMAVDEERGELYVANDMGDSVLVFKVTDHGNAKPTRIIKGSKTGIRNPSAVAVDLKHQELWVSNFGNHSATVYPLIADGDVAPLRTIRGGPADELNQMIGNPGAVGYDSKRQEILVPN